VQIPRWTDHVGSLPDSHQITVARDGGRIVGFIEAKRSGPGGENHTVGNVVFSEAAVVGEVEHLFVHPEAIGAGVGRLLLGAGEQWFAAGGIDAAILWVFSANTLY
jgi:GNAT superfamily N-acetyltransferase